MLTRWSTFTVWALVAASAVYWGLRLFVQPAALPAHAQVASAEGRLRSDLSRLLGADAPAAVDEPVAVADPRFQLLGVLSAPDARADREGVALIAVDERPPRAYRVGMVVDGDTVLQSVHARGASLGPRGGVALVALELPPPAPAATGNLPSADGAPAVGQPGPLQFPRPPGMGVPPNTQVFVPPGQSGPAFTRNRSPSPSMVPPPARAMGLPSPPPAQEVPQHSSDVDTDNADTAAEEGNPIR
jgi:general secretion pathway protein C